MISKTLTEQERADLGRVNKRLSHIFHAAHVPLSSDLRKDLIGLVRDELDKKGAKMLSLLNEKFPDTLAAFRARRD